MGSSTSQSLRETHNSYTSAKAMSRLNNNDQKDLPYEA
jgi:hypothetical protein